MLGKAYYFSSELYMFILGEIFHRVMKILLILLKKITKVAKLQAKEIEAADSKKRD